MKGKFLLFFSTQVNAGIKEISDSFASSINLQNGDRSVANLNASSQVFSDGKVDIDLQKQHLNSER